MGRKSLSKRKRSDPPTGNTTQINETSISDFLDTIMNDNDSFKSFLEQLLRREPLVSKLVEVIQPGIIKSFETRISCLEDQLEEMQQYSRRDCLKFSGIPEKPNENTDNLLLDIINNHILREKNEHIQLTQISRSHRVGKRFGSARDIIVRFTSYRTKALIYANKRYLKNYNSENTNKVFVNEALTQKRSSIFGKARQYYKERKIQSCWTYDGKIYAKPLNSDRSILIKTENDLSQFDIAANVSGTTSPSSLHRETIPTDIRNIRSLQQTDGTPRTVRQVQINLPRSSPTPTNVTEASPVTALKQPSISTLFTSTPKSNV